MSKSRWNAFGAGCFTAGISIFGIFFLSTRPSAPPLHSTTVTSTAESSSSRRIQSAAHKSGKKQGGDEYSLALTKPRHTPDTPPSDINETLFSYLLEPDFAKICHFSTNNSLPIIFVKSTVSEFDERQAVRETWGKLASNLHIAVIFMVGLPASNSTLSKARQESLKYADLLMGDYDDIYDHMPLKTLSMLWWYKQVAQKQCFSKRFLFSTDTDVIVFPDNLHRLTRKLSCFEVENTIGGSCWKNAPANRNEKDAKHFVSKKLWAVDTYPHYCSGSGFLMSHDVPSLLLRAIPVDGQSNIRKWIESFEHLNDVLYTGVLRIRAKVQVHSAPEHFKWFPVKSVEKCNSKFISSHNFKPPSLLRKRWKEFRNKFLQGCQIRNEW